MFPDMTNANNLTLDELAEIIPILKQVTPRLCNRFKGIEKTKDGYIVSFADTGGGVARSFRVVDGEAVDIVTISSYMH